ncbi:hypothetical protein KQH82_10410 [bacterium]|nr:hypothetical protein [bacterium]
MRQMQTIVIAALMLVLVITCGAQVVFGKPMQPRFFHYTYEFIPALQPGPVTLRLTLYDTTGCTDITAEFFQDDNMGYSGPKTFAVTKAEQEPSVTIDLPVVLPQDDTCGFWMKFESSCRTPQWAGRFWVTGPDSVEEWTHDVRVYAVNTREPEIIIDSSVQKWEDSLMANPSKPGRLVYYDEFGNETDQEGAIKALRDKANVMGYYPVPDGWVWVPDDTGGVYAVSPEEYQQMKERAQIERYSSDIDPLDSTQAPLLDADGQTIQIHGEFWTRQRGERAFHKVELIPDIHDGARKTYDSLLALAGSKKLDVILDLRDPADYQTASSTLDHLEPTDSAGYYRTTATLRTLKQLRLKGIRDAEYPYFPRDPKDNNRRKPPKKIKKSEEGSTSNILADDVLFSADFEIDSFEDVWSSGDDDPGNGIDTWYDDSYNQHQGNWSAWCAGNGYSDDPFTYDDNMYAWMINLSPIDVFGAENLRINYWRWVESEYGADFFRAYYSFDGVNWDLLESVSTSSGSWQLTSRYLPEGYFSLYISFVFDTDGSIQFEGAYVDDVQVIGDRPSDLPNLTYDTPPGWDGPLTVSHSYFSTSTDAVLYAQQPVYINWGVGNNGAAESGQSRTAVYIDNQAVSPLYSQYSIAPGGYDDYMRNVPHIFTSGYHTIRIVIDSLQEVEEEDETDNVWEETFWIAPAQPNLAFTAPTFWSDALIVTTDPSGTINEPVCVAGEPAYIRWGVINDGSAYAWPTTARVFVDGVLKGSHSIPGISAGQVYDGASFAVTLGEGTHNVVVRLDDDHILSEVNEDDNSASAAAEWQLGYVVASGWVGYRRSYFGGSETLPAAQIRVELWDENPGSPLYDEFLLATQTDASGYFTTESVGNLESDGSRRDLYVRAYAQKNTVKVYSESIEPWPLGPFNLKSTTKTNTLSGEQTWQYPDDPSLLASEDASAHFYIADQIARSRNTWDSYRPGSPLPSTTNLVVSSTQPTGYIPNDDYIRVASWQDINAGTPDTFDPDVIHHEFAHWVHNHLGFFDGSATSGYHGMYQKIHPEVAAREGFCHFWASAISGSADYYDRHSNFTQGLWANWETGQLGTVYNTSHNTDYCINAMGDSNEAAIACIFWDMTDAADDDHSSLVNWGSPDVHDNPDGIGDAMMVGVDSVLAACMDKLVGSSTPKTLQEFWEAWFHDPSYGHERHMYDLWYEHGVPVQDDYCCIGLTGNANGDPEDETDLADLIYLVSFNFLGGPPPPCMAEGNVNGDAQGDVELSDLIALVNYLFLGGPPPAPCPSPELNSVAVN